MKLGIKAGLKGDPFKDIDEAKPDFCEIWFHSGKIAQYDHLFEYLRKRNIPIGLHFWGALPDNTLANFAYPDIEILKQSRQLMYNTLDAARRWNAVYVNVHPAGSILTRVDFEVEKFEPFAGPADKQVILSNMEESLSGFAQYANNHNCILTVESVPARALNSPWTGVGGRVKPTNIGELLIDEITPLLTKIDNLYFANDFGHTGANTITEDRSAISRSLVDITTRLAAQTRLLHVSYLIPPYNGTDYHGCLYYDEFKTARAVPNYDEMKILLKHFINRNEVYALCEPEKDHPKNLRVLKQLISELS